VIRGIPAHQTPELAVSSLGTAVAATQVTAVHRQPAAAWQAKGVEQ